jgi:GNAT superfamily N-acetyltransferase
VSIVVRPATTELFRDVATMVWPRNPDSSTCWCLSHRLDWKTNRGLKGRARGEYVEMLCVDDLPIWSAWCIRARPGYRGRGISYDLLDGAVAYARSQAGGSRPDPASPA